MKKIIQITCKGHSQIKPDELKEFQGNFKTLSDENYQKLKSAISDSKIGFSFPIFVWKNKNQNYIIDGHQRLITVRRMIEEGWIIQGGKLPVDWIEAPDIKTAKKKVIMAISQYGEYNEESFLEFLQTAEIDFEELKDQVDLPLIDMDQFALDWKESYGQNPADSERDDEVSPVPKTPKTKSSELFLLDEHRLLCGDSTEKGNFTRLMDRKKADIVFTDPPYGINIVKVKGNKKGSVGGGGESKNAYPFGGLRPSSIGGSKPYGKGTICYDHIIKAKEYYPIVGDDKPFDPVPILSFAKNQIIFGANYFASHLPDGKTWFVWDKNVSGNFSEVELIWTSFEGRLRLYKYTWSGLRREGSRDQELQNRVHPTQKPVGLITRILEEYSKLGAIIIDPYSGSGSTLIACEKTGRICYGMEIDPGYCDVILDRWANYTSKDPIREDGKKWSKIKKERG